MTKEEYNRNFTKQNWIDLLTSLGWTYVNNKNGLPLFRRAGKNTGVSGGVIYYNGILCFHNFSSNANIISSANNKDTFSPFEFVLKNVYDDDFKKCVNDIGIGNHQTQFNKVKSFTSKQTKPQEPHIIGHKEPIYRFNDGSIQSEMNDYIISNSSTQSKASLFILDKYPNATKERLYRVSVNRSVRNKTKDFVSFVNNFENFILSLSEILSAVKEGFSISAGHYKTTNGKFIKNKDNFKCSELVILDIDKDYTLDYFLENKPVNLIAIYTSFNHSQELHKFRLIFELDFVVKDGAMYEYILKDYIKKYGSDSACGDCSRGYYGNTNAIIYNLITGETI